MALASSLCNQKARTTGLCPSCLVTQKTIKEVNDFHNLYFVMTWSLVE